jgi:hypothetical protein
MPGTILFILGLIILLSACLWAINKIAPEPFKTWLTVIVVVLVACWLAAMLMGYTTGPITLHHGLGAGLLQVLSR